MKLSNPIYRQVSGKFDIEIYKDSALTLPGVQSYILRVPNLIKDSSQYGVSSELFRSFRYIESERTWELGDHSYIPELVGHGGFSDVVNHMINYARYEQGYYKKN